MYVNKIKSKNGFTYSKTIITFLIRKFIKVGMELCASQSIEDQVTLATSCIIIWYTQNLLKIVCHLDKQEVIRYLKD